MRPILKEIFGSNASTSASYSGGSYQLVNLLAGRGPIDEAPAGDVPLAAPEHYQFGDITCAYLQIDGTVTTMAVCWYSSREFGASVLATSNAYGEMGDLAAALETAIPEMRDGDS